MAKPKLKQSNDIPSGRLSRFFKITKMAFEVGATSLQQKMKETVQKSDNPSLQKVLSQIEQAKTITTALSEMKGAAMKMGQVLAIQGEWILPPEVSAVLKTLTNQATYLEFKKLRPVFKRDFKKYPEELFTSIEAEPMAAASIGQVHRAVTPEGHQVAVKIQYPGVAQSISSDVKNLASLLNLSKILPIKGDFDEIIDEITRQLKQETDYIHEGAQLTEARRFFASTPLADRVVVPTYYPQYSSKRILTSDLISGIEVDDFAKAPNVTQEHRNSIGRLFLEVFFYEFFVAKSIQSDPNFANYMISEDFEKLILLDYGSTKAYSQEFVDAYWGILISCRDFDQPAFDRHAQTLGFFHKTDSATAKQVLYENCLLFMEPFRTNGPYNYKQSDLPKRIKDSSFRVVSEFKFRAPPKEILFLNRKILGIYNFLSLIDARIDPNLILEKFHQHFPAK